MAGNAPLGAGALAYSGAAELLAQLLDRGSLSWPLDDDDEEGEP